MCRGICSCRQCLRRSNLRLPEYDRGELAGFGRGVLRHAAPRLALLLAEFDEEVRPGGGGRLLSNIVGGGGWGWRGGDGAHGPRGRCPWPCRAPAFQRAAAGHAAPGAACRPEGRGWLVFASLFWRRGWGLRCARSAVRPRPG
jgi:hypothetical protein